MCDICDKNEVYQVLGPGDIRFASANMVGFRVMVKPYCVNKVACCQGCIKDFGLLHDALASIARRVDRVLPMNETLWPTPSLRKRGTTSAVTWKTLSHKVARMRTLQLLTICKRWCNLSRAREGQIPPHLVTVVL